MGAVTPEQVFDVLARLGDCAQVIDIMRELRLAGHSGLGRVSEFCVKLSHMGFTVVSDREVNLVSI